MNEKIRIGITGAGGGVGQSIIKSLYETDYHLVGLDGEAWGTGLYAVPTAYKIPYARSAEFIGALLEICQKEKIKILFPGMDAELKALSLHKTEFEAIGTTVVVSSPDVVALSNDKLLTYERLTALGIKVPVTMKVEEYRDGVISFPLIVKQRVDGARSKNVYLLKTKAEFETLLASVAFRPEEYIVQEYVEGDEYTCGTVNLNDECKGVIVMKRVLRDGDTYKCFSLLNTDIEKEVFRTMNLIKPFGACNVQLRLKDGMPYVFEINARCSGTTAARTMCGFNEPKMIADYLVHSTAPVYDVKELSIFRYWKELVVPNDQVASLKENGMLINFPGPHL